MRILTYELRMIVLDVQDLVASFGETVPSDYDEPEPDPIRSLNSDPVSPFHLWACTFA